MCNVYWPCLLAVSPPPTKPTYNRSKIMNEVEKFFIPKETWGYGPWMAEPDKVQWNDESTGLVCLAVRNQWRGGWCGYVGVPPEHRYFSTSHANISDVMVVHGGLDYSGFCQSENEEYGICHKPDPGQPEEVWWFGFSCQHAVDICPAITDLDGDQQFATYKDLHFVKQECRQVAQQLLAIE